MQKVVKMTKIIIGEDFIEIFGHAPEAVVCHGISAISQMVANYVEQCNWGKVERNDGYLRIYDVQERYCGSSLFQAMVYGLKDIETEYPGNIEFKYVQ